MIPAQSIITIIAASVICAALMRMGISNSNTSSLIRVITALFILLTVVKLISNVDYRGFSDILSGIEQDVDVLVTNGEIGSRKEIEEIIKTRVEAYILDRARSCGAELQVQIEDIDNETMIPTKVFLQGRISPMVKRQLKMEIENELGIPEENQVWN